MMNGNWSAAAYAEDAMAASDTDNWNWSVITGIANLSASYLTLELTFNEEMAIDAELIDPDNYTITFLDAIGTGVSAEVGTMLSPEAEQA